MAISPPHSPAIVSSSGATVASSSEHSRMTRLLKGASCTAACSSAATAGHFFCSRWGTPAVGVTHRQASHGNKGVCDVGRARRELACDSMACNALCAGSFHTQATRSIRLHRDFRDTCPQCCRFAVRMCAAGGMSFS